MLLDVTFHCSEIVLSNHGAPKRFFSDKLCHSNAVIISRFNESYLLFSCRFCRNPCDNHSLVFKYCT